MMSLWTVLAIFAGFVGFSFAAARLIGDYQAQWFVLSGRDEESLKRVALVQNERRREKHHLLLHDDVRVSGGRLFVPVWLIGFLAAPVVRIPALALVWLSFAILYKRQGGAGWLWPTPMTPVRNHLMDLSKDRMSCGGVDL